MYWDQKLRNKGYVAILVSVVCSSCDRWCSKTKRAPWEPTGNGGMALRRPGKLFSNSEMKKKWNYFFLRTD